MLTLAWPNKADYLKRLFKSHDFAIEVDVLNLDEEVVGSATFLDGQIDLNDKSDLVRRTASLTLSDPDGALDFSTSSAWSGTSVWVDRLVRVRHIIKVSNTPVEAICFVGPPTSMSRSGAEVAIVCADKAALATRGSIHYVVKTGANAVEAIRSILSQCTGEFKFRFPSDKRRLSKDYAVGLEDDASPMKVAARIARAELGMQLLYAADGYALLRDVPSSSSLTVPGVTEQVVSSVDFTKFNNYVKVFGKASTKKSGSSTIKTQPVAVVQIASSSNLSPHGLARKGVPRYLPLVITDDSYTKLAQVKKRAEKELSKTDQLETATQFACVPFFHGDSDDLITVKVDDASPTVRLITATIPLGVGDDMTIGTNRAASAIPAHKSKAKKLRWKRYFTGRKHHRKTHWRPI